MITRSFVFLVSLTLLSTPAFAQSLGTFRWQMQPYCDVLTLAVTQHGAVYTLDGSDDQCGAAKAASAIGTAFLNPDGTIGFGLNVVTSPGGAPIHVEASINLSNLNGTWHDSTGAGGAFVFTRGAGIGGNPRPASAGGIAPGSVTAASLAPNAVGSSQVDSSQVQLRIGGCQSGSFMQTVSQNGSATCASVVAGFGLTAAASTGSSVLSLNRTQNGAFSFGNAQGLVATGSLGVGSIPVSGPGTRMMWYPTEAAFRAGEAHGTEWDAANVGRWSTAFGRNVTASGVGSLAAGGNAYALGSSSVALGFNVAAVGDGAVALGRDARSETGAFTFADSSVSAVLASGPNQFNVRSAGGAGFYTNVALTAGVELAPGASSWSSVSDVNMKEHFRDLDDAELLEKLRRMPVREWSYKAQDVAIRHVGPTAQDFHAAFGLGEDPLRISTIDADGVALAGVKALDVRTRETDAALREELAALKAELAALRVRLDELNSKR